MFALLEVVVRTANTAQHALDVVDSVEMIRALHIAMTKSLADERVKCWVGRPAS